VGPGAGETPVRSAPVDLDYVVRNIKASPKASSPTVPRSVRRARPPKSDRTAQDAERRRLLTDVGFRLEGDAMVLDLS
jgi:hypothetical protein